MMGGEGRSEGRRREEEGEGGERRGGGGSMCACSERTWLGRRVHVGRTWKESPSLSLSLEEKIKSEEEEREDH